MGLQKDWRPLCPAHRDATATQGLQPEKSTDFGADQPLVRRFQVGDSFRLDTLVKLPQPRARLIPVTILAQSHACLFGSDDIVDGEAIQ